VKLSPALLNPRFIPRIWGARSLAPLFEAPTATDPIGEVWLTGEQCEFASGPLAGQSLAAAWPTLPPGWTGTNLHGTARIPLLVRYPRVARAGSTPAQLAQTIDFASTILEIAGVRDTVARDGRSLVSVLSGSPPSWRRSILIEYYNDTVFPRILTMGYKAVRTDRYKYIRYTDLRGMDELYDLETDPFEMENLVDTERGRALLPELTAELEWLQR